MESPARCTSQDQHVALDKAIDLTYHGKTHVQHSSQLN